MTVSITVKIIAYRPLIKRKQIGEVQKKQQGKFVEKVMVWLAVRSESVAPLVLFEKKTLDHHRYINEVLPPIAVRYGNSKFENNRTFQQDNRTAHTHQEM